MKIDRELYIIILLITITYQAFDDSKFALETLTSWRSILNGTRWDQTMFVDVDNENSVAFKNSILKNIHFYHAVVLINGIEVPETVTDEKLRTILKRTNNIVLTTHFLNRRLLDSPLLTFILNHHWSVLFILVTTEDRLYNCVNGTFSEGAMKNIEEFLSYLWAKHRVMFVILNLPHVCPEEYVVYNSTKSTEQDIFNRTIKVVNIDEELYEAISRKAGRMLTENYPLRGNIFHRFPTAIQDCSGTDLYIKTNRKHSGGFCGLDGLIMSDVVTHFGFNLTLPTLAPGSNKYGYQTNDGAVNGILEQVTSGNVDISFNSRFIARYTTGVQKYRYIHYVADDELCAISKQPKVEPLWHYPINSFSWAQWLFILTCLTSIGMLMWTSAKIKSKMHNTESSRLRSYILNSVNAGLFGFFLQRRKDLLLLRAACLYASIIILTTYQSYINYMFATRTLYGAINTLSDLAESGIVINTSPSIYNLVNESVGELSDIILSNTIVMEDSDSFYHVLQHPNMATLERKTDAIMLTWMKYTDDSGRPLLYVSNECIRSFYLSYISNLDFPFQSQIKVFMMRLIESGFPNMYYTWTSRALGLKHSLPSVFFEPRPASQITMADQVIAFGVLLVGYALAVTVFVVEIWWRRRTQRQLFVN